MKQTSIDKINKVYVAIKDSDEFKMYAELLKDVIRAEAMTPVKAGKFNIYNYVANDEIHPSMCGVYHENGMKVASDSHILIAIEEEYPEEMEGGGSPERWLLRGDRGACVGSGGARDKDHQA